MLIDSHCHLDFEALSADLDGVLQRAATAGVSGVVTISTRVRAFDRLLAIVAGRDNLWCSIGTHPEHAQDEPDVTVDELVRLAAHPKCVAIGEAGLDYHYGMEHVAAQVESFRRHIAASRETQLPLVIHARDADQDIGDILEEEMGQGPFPFVLHCFSSGAELARRGLALGGYLSFSGILTFRNAEEIREVAAFAPADRILVETDAPYLAPVPHRGQSNEPSFVRFTAERLAEVRGISFEALAAQTTQNFAELFDKTGLAG
jgi:TatD DNase family protein